MSFPVAIADTGALVAYYKEDEPDHAQCRRAMAKIGHLVTSPLVLAELDYLLTKFLGAPSAIQVLGHIADRVSIGRFEVADVRGRLHAAREVMRQYIELDIGLTDAMNVVIAQEFRTDTIFTIDRRHFRAVHPLTADHGFRLLPDDLD